MTALEALMWRAEADPVLRSHVTAIEPLLRVGPPVWAADPDFAIGYHLRRVSLPAPGGIRPLLELIHSRTREPTANKLEPMTAAHNHALSMVAPVVSHLPGPVLRRIGRAGTAGNDLQASNVLGIGHATYIAGAKVTHMYPFGPLPGCAAMVTTVSHAGICCVGANVDGAAVTATDAFATCLREGFDEVLALAPGRTTDIKETTA
jgi:diacylglycerol O-acyltransferase